MSSESELHGLQHLAAHLAGRGDDARLAELLTSFEFLQRKLRAFGAPALVADYEHLPAGSPLRSIQAVLRLAAQTLQRDPSELTGQLLGRLPQVDLDPAVARLVAVLRDTRENLSLLQPATPSLSPADGAMRQVLQTPLAVVCLTVTPDDRVLAGVARRVWVWDLAGRRPIYSLAPHAAPLAAVAVSPDGHWGVSADRKGEIRTWQLETSQESARWIGHEGPVSTLAVLFDSRRVLSAGKDGRIGLWDLTSGDELCWLEGHAGAVTALAVVPDGRTALSGSEDGTIRLWDLETGVMFRTLNDSGPPVYCLALGAGGRQLVSGGREAWARVWDLASGELARRISAQSPAVTAVALSPDGRYFAVASAGMVTVEDGLSGKRWVLGRVRQGQALAFSRDGTRLITNGAGVRVWDLMAFPDTAGLASSLAALAVTPDGRRAVVGGSDGRVAVWSVADGRLLYHFPGAESAITALTLAPDGSEVFLGDFLGGVRRCVLASGEALPGPSGFEKNNAVRALEWSRDGRHVIAGSGWGDILVWDLEARRLLAEQRMSPGYLITLALIPGTLRALVCLHHEDDQSPFVLDLLDGQQLRRLRGHRDAVQCVGVSADGRFAATGSDDETIKVWSLLGRGVRTLRGHRNRVDAVAFSTNGRFLVSCSTDRTVRLWHPESGSCLAKFTTDGGLRSCAVTPDGRTVVVSGEEGALHFLRWSG